MAEGGGKERRACRQRHSDSIPQRKAINKALKQSREGRGEADAMLQPSGTGYGISPFGEARSPHALTPNKAD